MNTQSAIIEGLQLKRAEHKKPFIALEAISEKSKRDFAKIKNTKVNKLVSIKESKVKDADEIPKGSLEDRSIVLFANGDKYVGGVCDGLPDGYGTIAAMDGAMYDGEWKNGIPNGKGTFIHPDSDLFIGSWKNGVRHGEGMYFIDNVVYEVEYEIGDLIKIDGQICEKKTNAQTSRKLR